MLSDREVRFLLEELCIQYGFCLPPEENERLVANTPSDAESFALAVFRTEGLEPAPSHRRLFQEVLAHLERAYDRARRPAT